MKPGVVRASCPLLPPGSKMLPLGMKNYGSQNRCGLNLNNRAVLGCDRLRWGKTRSSVEDRQ
ncbi:MAG: hypothetical protein V7K61_18005 [Nostoc sp.]